MFIRRTTLIGLAGWLWWACLAVGAEPPSDAPPAPGQARQPGAPALPAFPGAEGFGAVATGGRGGRVVKVTNLNASGPGSFRQACEVEKGPRIIVFEVSGVIPGPADRRYNYVNIRDSRVTIAAQTAPGPGVVFEGQLRISGAADAPLHDIVVRHLRVRPNFADQGGSSGDCIQAVYVNRLIFDHVSTSWSTDENMGLGHCGSMTVQWCTIEESELAGHDKGQHNYAMLIGYSGRDVTLHHNLFAHHSNRAPLSGLEVLDHRNNVIYNFRHHLSLHPPAMNQQRPGQPFRTNLVANYYKGGPNWTDPQQLERGAPFTHLRIWQRSSVDLYARGNYMTWLGRVQDDLGMLAGGEGPSAEKPWPAPPVRTHSAEEAYELVLAKAGALPRDPITVRTVAEVRAGTGAWGRDDQPADWRKALAGGRPLPDRDGDGIPDDWEKARGLDPDDPSDANRIVPAGASTDDRHRGYTWIEFYINDLADRLADRAQADARAARDRDASR